MQIDLTIVFIQIINNISLVLSSLLWRLVFDCQLTFFGGFSWNLLGSWHSWCAFWMHVCDDSVARKMAKDDGGQCWPTDEMSVYMSACNAWSYVPRWCVRVKNCIPRCWRTYHACFYRCNKQLIILKIKSTDETNNNR